MLPLIPQTYESPGEGPRSVIRSPGMMANATGIAATMNRMVRLGVEVGNQSYAEYASAARWCS